MVAIWAKTKRRGHLCLLDTSLVFWVFFYFFHHSSFILVYAKCHSEHKTYDCESITLDLSYLGPVVQSVVSLTSSLRVISLTVLADSIYNILIFFAEKM